ncbi:MAG: Carbohydrate binding family 6 [Acidimicrobiales bacterium]|nr:Carbohydrate binding family 6 [Acidimicrobiales bacterium]
MHRAVVRCAAVMLAAALLSPTSRSAALDQPPGEPDETLPSGETVRSLLMNNWTDSVAVHYARQLYGADTERFGPYLAAMHNAVDWPTNQIDGATAFIRAKVLDAAGGDQPTGPDRPPARCASGGDVTGDNAPVDRGEPDSYPSVMCFDDRGAMNVEYLRETELGLPVQIEKSYAMAPNERFTVVRYTVTNNLPSEDNKSVRVRLSEVVDLNNKAARDHEESGDDLAGTGINEPSGDQPVNDIQARWHPELNAWIADMSASNGTFLVFGAFQTMDRHRAFETVADDVAFDRAVAPETATLDQPAPPPDVEELTGKDLGLAMRKDIVLGPTRRHEYGFFYAVASSLGEAQDVARQARQPILPEYWFSKTAAAYKSWLQEGQQVDTPDPGLRKAYDKALITDKQSQQPEFGTFVAATNPAYGFKVWARDSSATALALAAAGHVEEAVKYYQWMASVQEDGSREKFPPGTWSTTYSYWLNKRPIPFVEPEHDSLGLFMIGVYRTWRLLNEQDPQAAREFLTGPLERVDQGPTSVYEAVTRAAEFVENNIDAQDFGPADFSIWEEDLGRITFTQVTYASGLNAARLLAEEVGETVHAAEWLEGARRINGAIGRPASAQPCPGLWNDTEERWNRSTRPDCTTDARLDASTDLAWVFGLVDASDERALSQREEVLSRLTPGDDDFGIARYEGDNFYFESPFSPGGRMEATAATPSWPQMDMYMAMLEHWTGLDDVALERLRWYVRVTNAGYMPPGEAVDWPSDRPLPSTASEPVTGSWYLLALLNHLDLFDPRLPPLDTAAAP